MVAHMAAALRLLSLVSLVSAQQIGTATPEVHPKLPTQFCTIKGGCAMMQTSLVTDALSRNLHAVGQTNTPCNVNNRTLCPSAEACSQNCALEGFDYAANGVSTNGNSMTLKLFGPNTNGSGVKVLSPRVYLLAPDEKNYQMLKLNNQEFTYDVDMSKAGCGVNGALYLSEMEESGFRSAANPAGAQYGTGYCDAQCFNTTFINGLANFNNSGACCNEMDIWEANNAATAMTPHTCNKPSSFQCSGTQCARGLNAACDKNGCGLNPFSAGSKNFYGPGKTVDTTRPFTVVTQFIAAGNTSTGALAEIRRTYIQDGKALATAPAQNGTSLSSFAVGLGTITQDVCSSKGNSTADFNRLGGMRGMGESLARGMVLIFSIWNDAGQFMNWLDSGNNGPCSATQGDPKIIMMNNSDAAVTFSNIRWGDIGSTVKMTANGTVLVNAQPENAAATGSAASSAGLLGAVVAASAWLLL